MSELYDERLPARFWDKVQPEPNSGCWLWTASCDRHGYGAFHWQHGMERAHRRAYVELVGPIKDGLQCDHLCRTRCCVNPAHIEPVTHAENVRRGAAGLDNATKTHCPHGHEYTEENTRKTSTGGRACKECNRRTSREWARESRRKRRAKDAC